MIEVTVIFLNFSYSDIVQYNWLEIKYVYFLNTAKLR